MSAGSPTWLGLDAGGSETRYVLLDVDAGERARGIVPPMNGLLADPANQSRMRQVAADLATALAPYPRPKGIVAGITGLSAATLEAALAAEILAAALGIGAHAVAVHDDVWLAYRAAFAPGEGHVVYAGSGAVGMHVRTDGTVVAVGARGVMIDDAGSAFGIGRDALCRVFRALDSDPEATSPLAEAIYAQAGGRTWAVVRTHVYADGRNRVAQMARAVAAAAQAGDAAALDILGNAGDELARLARALIQREGPRSVALLGRAARLHPIIAERFIRAVQGVPVRQPEVDAALAAARLAMETI